MGFSTDLYIDRDIPGPVLEQAFRQALNLEPGQVALVAVDDLDARLRHWKDPEVRVLMLKSTIPGDFPVGLDVRMKDEPPVAFESFVAFISKAIGAPMLTDDTGVDPAFADDWLMVSPDGTNAVVTAESEALAADSPALVLTPRSRRFYEAHRGSSLIKTG